MLRLRCFAFLSFLFATCVSLIDSAIITKNHWIYASAMQCLAQVFQRMGDEQRAISTQQNVVQHVSNLYRRACDRAKNSPSPSSSGDSEALSSDSRTFPVHREDSCVCTLIQDAQTFLIIFPQLVKAVPACARTRFD